MLIFRKRLTTSGLIRLARIVSTIAPLVIAFGLPTLYYTVNYIHEDKTAEVVLKAMVPKVEKALDEDQPLRPMLLVFLEESKELASEHHANYQVFVVSAQGEFLGGIGMPLADPVSIHSVTLSSVKFPGASLELKHSHNASLEEAKVFGMMGLVIGILIFLVARRVIIPAISNTMALLEEKQEQLLESIARAEEASLAKGRFLSNMSHEIRTPMYAIFGLTELLQKTRLTPTQRDYTEKLHTASQSLLGIINNILDYSKIESGEQPVAHHPFHLGRVLRRVEQIVSVQAREKGLMFRVMRQDGLPEHLLGDEIRLQQILINLTANAIKFTHKGEIELSVSASKKGDYHHALVFKVRDTGIGMTHEQIERLFKPFFQADESNTRKYAGTGLGLSIAKGLVEQMEGAILVDSKPGKGSTFTVSITFPESVPIAIRHDGNDQPVPSWNLGGTNILLVEDNEVNQMVASELLMSEGVIVETASNGKEAIDKLFQGEKRFDAVIMDIQMPVMDGYEAISLIRKEPRFERLPVVALTGNALMEERDKCLSMGINAYLTKPLHFATLYETVDRVIKQAASATPKRTLTNGGATDVSADLPELPGIDVSEAMARLLNKKTLLINLVINFNSRFSGIVDEIRHALDERDHEKAKRLAHSLNGASGNISAVELRRWAIELETALINEDYSEIQGIMDGLETAITQVQASSAILQNHMN